MSRGFVKENLEMILVCKKGLSVFVLASSYLGAWLVQGKTCAKWPSKYLATVGGLGILIPVVVFSKRVKNNKL